MTDNTSSLCSSPVFYHCCIIFTSLSTVKVVLILYLSTFVLYLGIQRWRRRTCKMWSHCDIITLHQASMDLLWVFGFFCRVCQDYFDLMAVGGVGMWAALITFYGEILFHVLTCAERYVAVVHPVTYRGLRSTRGVRIRNVSIGCVWLLCLFFICMNVLISSLIPLCCILGFALLVTSFCSLAVLGVLVRPGPGDGGGERERVVRSKRRAFCTITLISSTQWLWFVGLLVSSTLTKSSRLSPGASCLLETSCEVLNLPSSAVLPLLFLHRAGKLTTTCRSPGRTGTNTA